MNKLILLTCLLLAYIFTIAQEDEERDLHRMKQKAGSEHKIIDFFQKSNLPMGQTKTVYAIILNPMGCPRCEGAINPFIRELHKVDSSSLICLIVEYPKTDAVIAYLAKRKFEVSHVIIDNEGFFLKNFEFSSQEMQVPFITKINLENGVLISSESTLGITMDGDFVERIHSQTIPQMQVTATPNPVNEIRKIGQDLNVMQPTSKSILSEDDRYPISQISNPDISASGRFFCFQDKLANAIFVYEIKDTTASLINVLKPDEEEKKLFVAPDVGDTLYRMLDKMNILNSMYFNCNILDEESVVISASLPKIFWEDKSTESLAYYNKIAYLVKGLKSKSMSYFTLDTVFKDITLSHTNTCFDFKNNSIYVPISRGWPNGDKELVDPNDTVENPFNPKFYKQAPLMAKFDFQGNFESFIGKLDPTYAMNKVGYSFINLTVKNFDGVTYYTSGYSGDIYRFSDKQNYHEPIVFFTPSTCPINASYETEPLKYLQECQKIYNKDIIDFTYSHGKIYAIVKQDDLYRLVVYNGISITNQYDLPRLIKRDKVVKYFLKKNEEIIVCYGVFESPENSVLYKFIINQNQ